MKENKINWNRIKYFKLKEFVCPCCQKSVISEEAGKIKNYKLRIKRAVKS